MKAIHALSPAKEAPRLSTSTLQEKPAETQDSVILSNPQETNGEPFWKALKNRLESEGPDQRKDYLKAFGERLQTLRLARGLSQADLAHHAGLANNGAISALEAGKRYLEEQTALGLAQTLKISAEDLLDTSRPLPGIDPDLVLQLSPWKKQKTCMNTLSNQEQKDYLKAFGERLQSLRLARGLSQADLAQHAGLAYDGLTYSAVVSSLEAGKWYPRKQTALGLAKTLKISVEDLLDTSRPLSGIDPDLAIQLSSWKKQKTCVNTLSTQERKDYLKAFGERLQTLRLARGLTQADLAQHAGLAYVGLTYSAVVSRLEAGKHYPHEKTALGLAQTLKISAEDLLDTSRPLPGIDPDLVLQLSPWKKQKTCMNTLSNQEQKDYLKAFGERLQTLRLARGLSQADLAQHAGLANNGAISALEAGEYYPREQTALRLAKALKISVEDLLDTSRPLPEAHRPF